MIKPIIIPSSLEFVIVGPLMENDGILIQSSTLDIDLIGFANMYYSQPQNKNNKVADEIKLFNQFNINAIWSKFWPLDSSGRNTNLLFCFRGRLEDLRTSYIHNTRSVEEIYHSLEIQLNKFIENAFLDILKITNSRNPWGKESKNSSQYESVQSSITWKISPIILMCKPQNLNNRTKI